MRWKLEARKFEHMNERYVKILHLKFFDRKSIVGIVHGYRMIEVFVGQTFHTIFNIMKLSIDSIGQYTRTSIFLKLSSF